ncbi:MAG: hypothetical protein ACTSWY_01690 [Promethearchaeota archaeon]
MTIVNPEEIEILAFNLYKNNEQYDKMIWRLAELCKILQINLKNLQDDNWCNLNAFKTLDEIKGQLKHDKIIYPSEDQIKYVAKQLYKHSPERSKLHWYIAEKTLVLEKIQKGLEKT